MVTPLRANLLSSGKERIPIRPNPMDTRIGSDVKSRIWETPEGKSAELPEAENPTTPLRAVEEFANILRYATTTIQKYEIKKIDIATSCVQTILTKLISTKTLGVHGRSSENVTAQRKTVARIGVLDEFCKWNLKILDPDTAYANPIRRKTNPVTTL